LIVDLLNIACPTKRLAQAGLLYSEVIGNKNIQ